MRKAVEPHADVDGTEAATSKPVSHQELAAGLRGSCSSNPIRDTELVAEKEDNGDGHS